MDIGIRHALSEIRKNYSSLNWWKRRVFVPYVLGTASRFHPRYPGYEEGVSVMEEDWDNLIVLDACRSDTFEKVADLDRFSNFSTRISLGSHSSEWTRRNFQGKEFGDTVYVSANPHTSLIAGDSFHHIDELWETDFDEELGQVPAEAVHDAAIEASETFDNKRLIIHFMQPHGPFIGSDIDRPWADENEYWDAYEDNLEYVLQYVQSIVDSIDGKTIVTADHGEVYTSGLTDFVGIGGHEARLRLPGLVKVPWATIDGDRRKISNGELTEASGEHIQERLKQLGYV